MPAGKCISLCESTIKIKEITLLGFPGGSDGKKSGCNVGDLCSIPGLGRSPGEGKGYPLQYSGMENSMDCLVHGVTKSHTRLSDSHILSYSDHSVHFFILHFWKSEKKGGIQESTLKCLPKTPFKKNIKEYRPRKNLVFWKVNIKMV